VFYFGFSNFAGSWIWSSAVYRETLLKALNTLRYFTRTNCWRIVKIYLLGELNLKCIYGYVYTFTAFGGRICARVSKFEKYSLEELLCYSATAG
jgi:hypothetical protein